jgi:dienelactone hydrolase
MKWSRKTTARPWRWLRMILWAVFSLLVMAAILLAIIIVPVIPDPTLHFDSRKGQLQQILQTKHWQEQDSIYTELTLISSSGLQVELSTRIPKTVTTVRPLVLLLGGRRTGRDAVKLVSDTRGVALAAISYPFAGDPKASRLTLLAELPDIQQAIKDTTPAIMLAMDYLVKQPQIDPQRIELAGVSLGAFFVSAPGALDQRFRRVWLIHGAGETGKVLEKGTESYIHSPILRHLLGKLLGWITLSHHLGPEQWVGRISPRPVVIINAKDDPSFPASSIMALHNAVKEPYEIIWMESDHIMPSRTEIVETISSIVLDRIIHESNNN